MLPRLMFKAVPLLLVAPLATVACISFAAEPTAPAANLARMAKPEYDETGALLRPDGYERWTVVGTSIGLDYSKDEKENPNKPGVFHNVYLQPEAFEHYVETGHFPEQTVFVVTNNPATKREGENDIKHKGLFAGETTGLEVSVKDSKRFEEGWGYYMYYSTQGPRTASKPLGRQACYDCHAEHGAEDAVFTQFYTVLKMAARRSWRGSSGWQRDYHWALVPRPNTEMDCQNPSCEKRLPQRV